MEVISPEPENNSILVIVLCVFTHSHCGYCSDPGEYEKTTENHHFKIPFHLLSSEFIEKHICINEYSVKESNMFWIELKEMFRNKRNILLSEALDKLVDSEGNLIHKENYVGHNGYCDCVNYERFVKPYLIKSDDNPDDPDDSDDSDDSDDPNDPDDPDDPDEKNVAVYVTDEFYLCD